MNTIYKRFWVKNLLNNLIKSNKNLLNRYYIHTKFDCKVFRKKNKILVLKSKTHLKFCVRYF